MRAHVLLWALGNRLASVLSASVDPAQTHEWPCLPPFPVPYPGAIRCRTVLLCYARSVPMGPAAHSWPSPSCPCTRRWSTWKMQGACRIRWASHPSGGHQATRVTPLTHVTVERWQNEQGDSRFPPSAQGRGYAVLRDCYKYKSR
jgi:hypothetical protein